MELGISHRSIKVTALAVPLLALPLALAACGSSGGSGGVPSLSKAPSALCANLNAVLSDGPDPDADPVGYALSQIQPLGQLHSSDSAVIGVMHQLISADQALVKASGNDHSATQTIKAADTALNEACPGVAP
ncbi:MAG TPA: hypothetical protein VGG38_17505 [Acidimicrobiales bacterium]|jgi:hypothetical protein